MIESKISDSPLLIGVTGGIGAGKSVVCRIFSALGVPVYDADSRAKTILSTNAELRAEVIKAFGEEAYDVENRVNRVFLANKVFNDSNQIELLNSLVHPRVKDDFKNWIEKNLSSPYLIKEAALLFETGSYKELDKVIVVFAPVALRIERTALRDPQRSLEEIKAIMQKQLQDEEKNQKADFVIINDDKKLVIPQVIKLHHQFSAR